MFITINKIISKSKCDNFKPEQLWKWSKAKFPENAKTGGCDN